MGQDPRIIDDFDSLWEALRTHKGALVLYGAGLYGGQTLQILRRAGYQITAFCDGNPAKAGTRHHGVPVISIAQLKEYADAMVITSLAQTALQGACRGLLEAGITRVYAVVLPEFSFAQLKTPLDELPQEIDVAGESGVLFPCLADEASRAAFAVCLYASLSGDRDCVELPDTDCPVQTELTIEGQQLPLFRRQARTGYAICLRWSFETLTLQWLIAMAELYDLGYRRFWLCPQAGVLQLGGEKA